MVWARWVAACLGGLLFAAAMLNTVAYHAHAEWLGGSAVHVKDGRHYVNNHGRFTEVSEGQAERVKGHRRWVWTTNGLGVLGLLLCLPALLSQRPEPGPDAESGAADGGA